MRGRFARAALAIVFATTSGGEANPDLPERIRTGAVLNTFDRTTSYGGGAHGYTDYPMLDAGRDR